MYFINHRYDGVQLWQLQSVPWLHHLFWVTNFISFFFLYPSTFNLLEVAAVDKPKMHLWESGIMRITRHPQVLVTLKLSILKFCLDVVVSTRLLIYGPAGLCYQEVKQKNS